MTSSSVIAALALPADARVDKRVPKTLLVENGAPTAADKRQINEGIEELLWVAALKPTTIGVPAFRDDSREYLEVAVLSLTLRTGAKASRLTALVHRAIPYPVFLIQPNLSGIGLSLSHIRWSQGQSGQTVLDGPFVTTTINAAAPTTADFLGSLNLAAQPRQNLHALYQGWIERCEACTVAQLSGRFTMVGDAAAAECRRTALAEYGRLAREIATLRAQTKKERQLNRRVDLNLEIKRRESRLAALVGGF